MNHFTSAGRNIMISEKYFKLYLRDALEQYGINAAEGLVLHMMKMKSGETTDSVFNGKTQDEIIREIHYDKGVMTRTMKSLEEKGYVKRSENPADSRSFLFILTDKGEDIQEIIRKIFAEWENALVSGLDENETAVFMNMLEKASENALKFYSSFHEKS